MLLCSDHWPRTDRRDSGPEPGSAHRGPATDGLGQGPDGVQTAPLCSAWLGAQLGRLKLGGVRDPKGWGSLMHRTNAGTEHPAAGFS